MRKVVIALGAVCVASIMSACGSDSDRDGPENAATALASPSALLGSASPSPAATDEVVAATTFTIQGTQFSLPRGWKVDPDLRTGEESLWLKGLNGRVKSGTSSVAVHSQVQGTLTERRDALAEREATRAETGDGDFEISNDEIAGHPAFRISVTEAYSHNEHIEISMPNGYVVVDLRVYGAGYADKNPQVSREQLDLATRMFIGTFEPSAAP